MDHIRTSPQQQRIGTLHDGPEGFADFVMPIGPPPFPVLKSSAPVLILAPGACITPSNLMNSETISFRIEFSFLEITQTLLASCRPRVATARWAPIEIVSADPFFDEPSSQTTEPRIAAASLDVCAPLAKRT